MDEKFITVVQYVRGRYQSEGIFMQMRPFKVAKGPTESDESSDAWDTIEWLVKYVPNNNGRVGIVGASYQGFLASIGKIDSHPAPTAASLLSRVLPTNPWATIWRFQVSLKISTPGTDADWVVKWIDVYAPAFPDPKPNPTRVVMGGYQQLLRGDVMRSRFRKSFEIPEPMNPEDFHKAIHRVYRSSSAPSLLTVGVLPAAP